MAENNEYKERTPRNRTYLNNRDRHGAFTKEFAYGNHLRKEITESVENTNNMLIVLNDLYDVDEDSDNESINSDDTDYNERQQMIIDGIDILDGEIEYTDDLEDEYRRKMCYKTNDGPCYRPNTDHLPLLTIDGLRQNGYMCLNASTDFRFRIEDLQEVYEVSRIPLHCKLPGKCGYIFGETLFLIGVTLTAQAFTYEQLRKSFNFGCYMDHTKICRCFRYFNFHIYRRVIAI